MKISTKVFRVMEKDALGAEGNLPGFLGKYLKMLRYDSAGDALEDQDFFSRPELQEVDKTFRSFGFPIKDALERLQIEHGVDYELENQLAKVVCCFLEVWETSFSFDGGVLLDPKKRFDISRKGGELVLKYFLAEIKASFKAARSERKRQLKAKRLSFFRSLEKKKNLA